MKKFYMALLLALASVVGLTWVYQGESTTFHGIAEAAETSVSLDQSAEITLIRAVSGQFVHIGDTLVVLSRPELVLRMNELTRELGGIEGKTNISTAEIDRQVAEINAKLMSEKSRIRFEIQAIQDEYNRNKAIAASLRSIPAGSLPPTDSSNASLTRIRALERELSMLESSSQQQVRLLRGSQGEHRTTGNAERVSLEKELSLLQQEQERLVIRARESGVVGSVNFREGEKVSPFSPILTLTPRNPTLVRGYIHERVYNQIKLGDTVVLSSIADRGGVLQGVVVGVGSRIVELPVRLRKIQDMLIWGREVTIRIPDNNGWLLGEQVEIHPMVGWRKVL